MNESKKQEENSSLDQDNTEVLEGQDQQLGEENAEDQTQDVTVPPELIENIAIGVLGHYLPNLQKEKSSLDEVLMIEKISKRKIAVCIILLDHRIIIKLENDLKLVTMLLKAQEMMTFITDDVSVIVCKNQTILLDTITQENAKFSDCRAMGELTESMLKAKRYYQKLISIKKEMQLLSEKSFKLKKRALKLQQQKQKEEFQREQQKEKEYEREKMLTATVATKSEQKSS